MPVPLAPYPSPPAAAPYTTPPSNGAQSQLVCSGCRNLLLYPVGATSVCCAVCNAVTAVPPPEEQQVCNVLVVTLLILPWKGLIRTWELLFFSRVVEMHNVTANQVAHVNCGNCRMLLMYQYGARSVKCAVCNFVTSVGVPTTTTTEQKFNG
ncbi:hypothetical protein F8388_013858 [Cannabis sativa]|uniref:Zinc finger LSD1-type domain-containing protein n=1 Tax=Cannabis sativa TaxID=3483 RepID=A0A7J6EB37_CANSA|nr:hypothetical protein F8388_013858 [Cannabis sativa]